MPVVHTSIFGSYVLFFQTFVLLFVQQSWSEVSAVTFSALFQFSAVQMTYHTRIIRTACGIFDMDWCPTLMPVFSSVKAPHYWRTFAQQYAPGSEIPMSLRSGRPTNDMIITDSGAGVGCTEYIALSTKLDSSPCLPKMRVEQGWRVMS